MRVWKDAGKATVKPFPVRRQQILYISGVHQRMHRWSRGILGGGVLLVVAAVGLWLAGAADSAAGESVTMLSVSPASQNVQMGSAPFKVDIAVDNVQNLGAYEFTLRFDPNVLEYIGASEKGFLKTTGRAQICQPATPLQQANNQGGVQMGCNTRDANQTGGGGPAGPNGSAVLAAVGFKPKNPGTSQLFFDGLEAGPQPTAEPGKPTPVPEVGKTGLGTVDVCDAGCNGQGGDISFTVQTGVVAVIDPNAGPTPSAPPATPTLTAAQPVRDTRKTAQAVLGTPERFLGDGTPVPGAPDSTGASSSGGGSSGSGASGSVAGASSGGGAGRTGDIAPGSPGAGGSRSASRTPRAGYGPDVQPRSPWPGRASLALALAGMGAIAVGVVGNRRRQRA